MNCSRVFRFSSAASTLFLSLAACAPDRSPLAPIDGPQASVTAVDAVECAATSWMATSGYIGPAGGTLTVPGASVAFPAGALSSNVLVSFSVGPTATDSLEVVLQGYGAGSTTLAVPATVTVDVGACSGPTESGGALLNTTTGSFTGDSTTVVPATEAQAPRPVVLSVVQFAWYIIAD